MNLLPGAIRFAALAIACFEFFFAQNAQAQCQWYDLTKALRTGGGLAVAVNPQNHNTIYWADS